MFSKQHRKHKRKKKFDIRDFKTVSGDVSICQKFGTIKNRLKKKGLERK